MNKTFNESEFTDLVQDAIMKVADEAKEAGHSNVSFEIMMTGMIVISEICSAIFDEDTESITFTKE